MSNRPGKQESAEIHGDHKRNNRRTISKVIAFSAIRDVIAEKVRELGLPTDSMIANLNGNEVVAVICIGVDGHTRAGKCISVIGLGKSPVIQFLDGKIGCTELLETWENRQIVLGIPLEEVKSMSPKKFINILNDPESYWDESRIFIN